MIPYRIVLAVLLLPVTVGLATAVSQQAGDVRVPMVSTVTDTGQHLKSDGLGPYVDGVDRVNKLRTQHLLATTFCMRRRAMSSALTSVP